MESFKFDFRIMTTTDHSSNRMYRKFIETFILCILVCGIHCFLAKRLFLKSYSLVCYVGMHCNLQMCKMYSLQYIAFITRCQHRQILARLVSRQKLKLWDFDQTLLLPLIYVRQHLHKFDDDVLCLYNTIFETYF